MMVIEAVDDDDDVDVVVVVDAQFGGGLDRIVCAVGLSSGSLLCLDFVAVVGGEDTVTSGLSWKCSLL